MKNPLPLLLAALLLCGAERMNAQVIAGSSVSLFRCSTGDVMACGYNSYGQLGDGTTTDRYYPILVNGISNITTVAAGDFHSLLLKNDGTVWACGLNGVGQLGDGTTAQRNSPVQVSGLIGITAGSTGNQHSLFLKNDGTVWACGLNGVGQLGDGTTTDKHLPVQVSGLSDIIAVAAGTEHSTFLKDDGTVWACGYNGLGQLGDGTNTDRPLPVQVSGLTGVIAVAAGGHSSLFLKNDGTVWACGYNQYGQLGDGTTTLRYSPVQVSGLFGITAVAAGNEHSLFLKNDGTVWACGYNYYGQLGDGTTTNRNSPVQVSGLSGSTAVAAGSQFSLFLKNNGTVWACGYNGYGQLGDGTDTTRHLPVQVQNLCIVSPALGNYPHHLTGNLYDDDNNNCTKQINEKALSSIAVVTTPRNLYGFSNDTGYFSLGVHDSVNYTVQPIIPQRYSHFIKNPCPANYSVQLDVNDPVDTSGFDFGFDANLCHQLRVAIGENRKRRCAKNTMSVYYWNEGTAAASNVALHVKFSQYDIPVSASLPFTWSSDSSIVFNLGTLNASQSGSITIVDSVACVNGITALTQCTRAWILPVNQCYIDSTQGTGWDKSETRVTGTCVNDSLVCFKIKNHSSPPSGNMQGTAPWRLYINDTLVTQGAYQLAGRDSLIQCYPANGKTYRLEADQRLGHPGNSKPRAIVEACGNSGNPGFVNTVPQDDADPDVAVSCLPIRDSYDPNDKTSSPSGIGASRIVLPETPVDFLIRFQNTGNDTAYKVVIKDTLSADYDLATLELGAASHPHTVTLTGEGQPVLIYTFDNINLVDSTTNEPLSHGFVNYRITPKTTVPLGTQIDNTASIYFDFNPPIVTNNAFITLGNYAVSAPVISGKVFTEANVPIPGVTVTLAGDDTLTTTTATDGSYNFTATMGGNYTVTPSKNNDSIVANGITAYDILLMRRHLLAVGALPSPYKIIAAAEVSADGDTVITTQDIVHLRSLILGNSTALPGNRLWQFVSSDYVFTDNTHPFPFNKTRSYTNIISSQSNQNFIGIKLGDVNESWEE